MLAMSDAQTADSCGYEEERFDESVLAEKTAQLLGRTFSRRVITPEEYFDIVPYVMQNMEQPLGDASAIVLSWAAGRRRSTRNFVIPGKAPMNFLAATICTGMQSGMEIT